MPYNISQSLGVEGTAVFVFAFLIGLEMWFTCRAFISKKQKLAPQVFYKIFLIFY